MKSIFLTVFLAGLHLFSSPQSAFTADKALQQLLPDYYNLKNALVKDDANAASISAMQLASIVKSVDEKLLTATEKKAFAYVKGPLIYTADSIAKTTELDQQREHFAKLSETMSGLTQAVPLSQQPVYLDYCPMKKARWLSSDKAIQNPYYGNQMLSCGSIEKTLVPGKENFMPMNNHMQMNGSIGMHHSMPEHDMQMNDTGMYYKQGMNMDATRPMSNMTHAFSLSLPMSRDGSGTSWSPDNTPMYMIMAATKKGTWMFHGSIFLRYDNQQLTNKTSRSDAQFDAPNWFMAMYNRRIGKNGLFNFTGMFSLDPLTVTLKGYPLLFQSGESYKGQPLVDRQHPHDLFAGLTLGYTQRLSKKVDVFGYFGYPAEPAVSAPTFMHRVYALNDPDAPLSHHWQDATHITFGVATLGVRVNKFKLEVSDFTGREPDENRYDFDRMRFDSYSWRLSFNPSEAWALQLSQGHLKSPEALHPKENVWRYTASVLYSTPVNMKVNYFTSALVWGMNNYGSHDQEHSVLLEGVQQYSKQALYGRYEFVQKSAEELALENLFSEHALFNVHKFTLGTNRILLSAGPIEFLGGMQTSINFPSDSLQSLYGKAPMSGQIYIQIRPKIMMHAMMGKMKM